MNEQFTTLVMIAGGHAQASLRVTASRRYGYLSVADKRVQYLLHFGGQVVRTATARKKLLQHRNQRNREICRLSFQPLRV